MELEPVRHLPRPGYPTRKETESGGGWLLGHLPENWKRLVAAGGTGVVLLAAGMAGCDNRPAAPAPGAGPAQTQATRPSVQVRADVAAVVAPIFDHGEGRGAVGCMVIAPPVFLTEEDALGVIQDELKKLGIELDGQRATLAGVAFKEETNRHHIEGVAWIANEPAKPLELQLVDKRRGVGIEFVGEKNYFALGGPQSNSTVQSFDFKGRAGFVAGQVRQKGKGLRVGILYDPAARLQNGAADVPAEGSPEARGKAWEKAWKEAAERSRDAAREELRKQVRDLAAWLKQQGAA
jgi:hypothetical protein